MRFRNLRAEELEGSTDIPGLKDWLRSIGATDAAVLILAPPGTGKAAAVGKLAHRLGRNVVLCNLMELLDYEDPQHQLENLLRICDAQRESVIYLDKLDKTLELWTRKEGDGSSFTTTIERWLADAKEKLLEEESVVVFTGRDRDALPDSLLKQFDKCLGA